MRIYFSGIGGVAIGPLAMIAQDLGHEVLGSDLHPNPVTEELKKRGVDICFEQDGANITAKHAETPINLFVYTASLPGDHSELRFTRTKGIPAVKRHELINKFLRENNLKLLAVSGTHGKTTTTAMLLWVMLKLGINVSHSVGTNLGFAPIGRYQPGSEYFVYEADEFDRNFLQFSPLLSLITSIDYDHSDTYPTQDDYRQAFKEFMSKDGVSFVWSEDASNLNRIGGKILEESDFNNASRPNSVGINLAGLYNRRNATLVYEALRLNLNLEPEAIVEQLNAFPGTARRFEQISPSLYSDYAHHPTEIIATLELARELTTGKVVVVYQPHQNIRQLEILKNGGYAAAFSGADKVYWLPTYLSREDDSLRQVLPEELAKAVLQPTDVEVAKMDDDLKAKINSHLAGGDTVIAMAAGDLDGWLRKVVSI